MDQSKLQAQMDRFIKSGFKRALFTHDLYEMLHVRTNVFIAHFDKHGFYAARFERGADRTIELLDCVTNEYADLCGRLAEAMAHKVRTETVSFEISTVVSK